MDGSIEREGGDIMGTIYYGVCHDCKKFIDLGKFSDWRSYEDADHATIEKTSLEDYKTDHWICRTLRLHIFLYQHNGHRIGVYTEHDFDVQDDYTEQFPWPSGLRKLTEEIDMMPSVDRVVINTPLGQIYIDNRKDDINCFRWIDGKRVDTKLL